MTKASPCLPALLALSASLRDARTSDGLGLRRLAHKLGISAQTLSLWETGKRAPAIEDVAHILGYLRVGPAEYHRVMRLRRQLDAPISIETLDVDSVGHQRALEELAIRTFEWAPHEIPKLLRTPDDIDLAIFEHHVRQLDAGRTGDRTVLLGAGALDPAIDAQLHALRAAAGLPGLTVGIVPSRVGVAKTSAPFTIYETGGKVFTVALRHQDNLIFVSEPDTVQRYRATFKALERESVTPLEHPR
ncbi:Scr1 family TA system antitoxin-like transcriptional regulator [Amycolatopsis sp. lyj-346]|uniref:Scr1 family TA system antitoxin-like transcriptional regulator n=1 Tax=Amycolatopsis sp. lyj-346 TaxID=2789289 RepID=UPI003979D4B1